MLTTRTASNASALERAIKEQGGACAVVELDRNQPEFKMTFDRYLEIVVSDERVKKFLQDLAGR